MSIWIADKDKYGEYQFDERIWPNWYTPETINVSHLVYYRNIIKNSNITYYLYTSTELNTKDLEELKRDWMSFCVPE